MPQLFPSHFSVRRAVGAYVAAILVGSTASAAVVLVEWLRQNGYDPARTHHLFVAKFFVPWLAAVSILLVGMAPLLVPMYLACIVAIQKRAVRSRVTFMAFGVLFAVVAWLAFSAWHCWISTHCSITPASITHLPFDAVIEIIVIGAASGIACRSVLFRRSV